LIESVGHPDVTLIEPLTDKERIGIEQARDLRQSLSLLPSQGRWRVVIVRADLTDQASDALLKTLEEPSPRVVLILTARDVEAVSETIASRCRIVMLGLIDTDTIVGSLEESGVDSERARVLGALSYGSIGWAKAAALDPELANRRLELRDNLTTWSSMSLAERLFAAEAIASASGRSDKRRDLIIEELEILMTWWRDVLLATSGNADLIVNSSSRQQIEGLAAGITSAQAQDVLRAIAAAGARIDQNVDPRLTLESLAIAVPMGTG
jgi:DNA polymerase-3 subunit delta'